MGRFSNLAKAERFGQGTYFPVGNFEVQLVKAINQRSKDKRKGNVEQIITEWLVLKTTNEEKAPVGSVRSWYVDLSKPSAESNIAGWLDVCFGEGWMQEFAPANPNDKKQCDAADEKLDEFVASVFNEAQILNGITLALETFQVTTQAGGQFTVHKWKKLEEATPADEEIPY